MSLMYAESRQGQVQRPRIRLVVFPLQFISFAAALRSTPRETSTVAAWAS